MAGMGANLTGRALERLQQRGYKLTSARRAVVRALAEAGDHLSAPQVVAAVRVSGPRISRASVYRTLDLLHRQGLVQASSLGGPTTTYLLAPGGHHHHVVCVDCRRTVAFDECTIRELERTVGDKLGFAIAGHLVELYGHCPDCRG